AVVLVLPGEELMVADVFARESVEPLVARGYGAPVYESGGCCEDDRPVPPEYVIGYVYEYPEKWITIP
ncbi:MAG: hypothetical protein PVI01_16605, partial [Gemmatimonadales bacterium]